MMMMTMMMISPVACSDFVKQHYTDLKALNPGLPIYIRPADGVQPHIAARYGTFSVPRRGFLPSFLPSSLNRLLPVRRTSPCLVAALPFSHHRMLMSHFLRPSARCYRRHYTDRGVYDVRATPGMSADQVLTQVEQLENAAPSVNASIGGGVGGSKFKLADII